MYYINNIEAKRMEISIQFRLIHCAPYRYTAVHVGALNAYSSTVLQYNSIKLDE
jgi:hypothetical protein